MMADSVTEEVDGIFRRAVSCRVCFMGPLHLRDPLINIAQPRWIGPRYWDGLRTVLMLVNPAAGEGTHDVANEHFRGLIVAYRNGDGTIDEVFAHQKKEIPQLGEFPKGCISTRDLG